MDKSHADCVISQYMEKIYGFALSKTMNTYKAEELASRITLDVYMSLLKSSGIENIAGYVYRVASNVYARFVEEEVRGRHISLDEVIMPCESDIADELLRDEANVRLRREISYLGRIQREIIVMHYYQRLKQNEIAERLQIPLGTVKWHLHDARNHIKEGITQMTTKGTLGVTPIKLSGLGHSGDPGPAGKDTSFYLARSIAQNIAYAAYHQARSIPEIAEEIGIPAAFVEDEVAILEENGFLDKQPGGKYLTNILLYDTSTETLEKENILYNKYARIVREKYVPLIFEAMSDCKSKGIYSPGNDENFLMWSAAAYACGHKLWVPGEHIDLSRYDVKRKDGGQYIATAWVERPINLSYDNSKYGVCGDMTRGNETTLQAWQINTYYDDRQGGWRDNLETDYFWLYDYIRGKLPKDDANVEKYKRLFDKGYLVAEGDGEYVNMLVAGMDANAFASLLPDIPEELKPLSAELDAEIYKINKPQYPAHMQDLCRAWSQNCLCRNGVMMRVIEMLAADNTLKPLTAVQKHSVFTILFCDTLPK